MECKPTGYGEYANDFDNVIFFFSFNTWGSPAAIILSSLVPLHAEYCKTSRVTEFFGTLYEIYDQYHAIANRLNEKTKRRILADETLRFKSTALPS